MNAEDGADRNIQTLSDIGKDVPDLDTDRLGVAKPAQAAIFIRGIGLQDHIITIGPSVGLDVDGIYFGRQRGANLSLANMQRVEVLRGPQDTLFGKYTLGGAVTSSPRGPGDYRIKATRADRRCRSPCSVPEG